MFQPELLVLLEGSWDVDISMTPSPGLQAQRGVGVETVERIGHYWTSARLETKLMGKTLVGQGQLGFDAKTGSYVGTWIDSRSGDLTLTEGQLDEESGELTMRHEVLGPTGQPFQVRSVLRLIDVDHREWKSYVTGADGQENLLREVKYSRRKKR